MEINIIIGENLGGSVEAGWLKGIARQILAVQMVSDDVELGLVITGQEEMRRINRDYLGKDEPTDVIAFALLQSTQESGLDIPPFVLPPDGVEHLGEVIIAYPQAVIQAGESRHPVKREITQLVIHGVLHLLGYDHDQPEQKRRMVAREKKILSCLEGGLD